ncbi:RES family NAD+ phosphorylase [Rhizobium sp. NLR17b]|uniref:RES family NAD+ phosphorylase n=1 Tax=Rhizobium sp. NLR17b TaxID=2731114 RepID=UPI001C8397DF|nr:RES family NAD+ phosphorylase [Rhizobium sp. NLR17b]MBX5272992.1 RES family NAD+ phosphorylase [Rhizobium sp. NLR17b]
MPPTITRSFPPMPLGELTALIDAFPLMSTEEKKRAIDRLVAVHPFTSLQWGPGWRFRRCRSLGPSDLPATVDELIWRRDVPAKLGRANPEDFGVLYLADRQDTALNETRVIRSRAAIAEFEIRDGRSIRIAPMGEMAQIQRTGQGFLAGEASAAFHSTLNACPIDDARSLLITDAFLLDCFVGHDEYEVSSHLAQAIFAKCRGTSAIAYSSRRQHGAINLAVRTEDFWQAWGLVSVRCGMASHLAMGYYDFAPDTAVDGVYQDGRLRWTALENSSAIPLLEPPYTPAEDDLA